MFGFQQPDIVFEHEELLELCVVIANTSESLRSGLRAPIPLLLRTQDDTAGRNSCIIWGRVCLALT